MKLQWKLFFRSPLRVLLVLILFLGFSIYMFCNLPVLHAPEGWGYYGGIDFLRVQLRTCIYFFILILFLSFDYFREVPDGELLEILRVSGHGFRHDCKQALVLFAILLIYSVLFLLMQIGGFCLANTFTLQLLFYLLKITGNYVLLNGTVAILLSWLLSRTVGKLLGYICLVLFACMVSPMLTAKLETYVLWARGIYNWFRMLILMPQGLECINPFTLYTMNLTLAARPLFWIGTFVAGLAVFYKRNSRKEMDRRQKRKGRCLLQWLPAVPGLVCAVFALIYSGLPASFYSVNHSLSMDDSGLYDQWRYVIEGEGEKKPELAEEELDFQVLRYDIQMTLARRMKTEVCLYPDSAGAEYYPMTLYHLYQIDEITDEKGEALQYLRTGDSLIVYGTDAPLEMIRVVYHGGCANFYSNQREVNLPGWFAYYPIPGTREIYRDYSYIRNTLETPAEFDITIECGNTKIYSDLERVEGNHFHGATTGPTLLAGFVKETELENGIRCIYPYLDKMYTPDMGDGEQNCSAALEVLQEASLGQKTIVFTPWLSGDQTYIYEENRVVDIWSWRTIRGAAAEGGNGRLFTLTLEELEAKAIDSFVSDYHICKAMEDVPYNYETVFSRYMNKMAEYGYTEEEFEEFFLEHLGQEEWNELTGSETDVKD